MDGVTICFSHPRTLSSRTGQSLLLPQSTPRTVPPPPCGIVRTREPPRPQLRLPPLRYDCRRGLRSFKKVLRGLLWRLCLYALTHSSIEIGSSYVWMDPQRVVNPREADLLCRSVLAPRLLDHANVLVSRQVPTSLTAGPTTLPTEAPTPFPTALPTSRPSTRYVGSGRESRIT